MSLRSPDGITFSEDPRIAAQEIHLALRLFVAELLQRGGVAQDEKQRLSDAEVRDVLMREDKFAIYYESARYVPSADMVDAALSGENFEIEFSEESEPETLYQHPLAQR